jgi:hypothetical protein
LLAHLKFAQVVGLDLSQMADQAGVFQVTFHRLVQFPGFAEAQLHRFVAVGLLSLDLSNNAGAGLNYRDWHHAAIFLKDLTHANFSAQEPPDHNLHLCLIVSDDPSSCHSEKPFGSAQNDSWESS